MTFESFIDEFRTAKENLDVQYLLLVILDSWGLVNNPAHRPISLFSLNVSYRRAIVHRFSQQNKLYTKQTQPVYFLIHGVSTTRLTIVN
jgi:hypothetical protein